MKKYIAVSLLITCSIVFISCKDEVKDTAPTEESTKVVTKKAAEPEVVPLTKEQKDAKNAVMMKVAQNKDSKEFSRVLVTAGLFTELSNLENDFTVLAFSNDVFNALPKTQNVFNNPARKEDLVALMKTHIVKGKVTSSELMQQIQQNSKYTLTTLSGATLEATMKDDAILITNPKNGSKVTLGKTDIQGTNGVLHLVDGFFAESN